MIAAPTSFRLVAATGIHRGDRPYQQDQVGMLPHPRAAGCVMAVVADGMGGKSGGRKAADQVVLTARQVFDRYVPAQDEGATILSQLLHEAHLMIKLTAIAFEEEPHSTLAAFIVTDIGREVDERLSSFALTSKVAAETGTPVISAGMVRTLDDVSTLKYIYNIHGAMIGQPLFDHSISLPEAIALAQAEPEPMAAFQ